MMNGEAPIHVGWIFGFLFLAIIIGLLIRGMCQRRETPRWEEPLEILKRRYAKGEISEEEFEHMKKELGA